MRATSPGQGLKTRRESAGLLMFQRSGDGLEVFLVHPGGPFFADKDEGSWSVPKGLVDPGETRLVQRGGKRVFGWAFEGAWPAGAELVSNTFELEWPRGSGRFIEIPEVDRGEVFPLAAARRKINPAQEAFLDRLVDLLN